MKNAVRGLFRSSLFKTCLALSLAVIVWCGCSGNAVAQQIGKTIPVLAQAQEGDYVNFGQYPQGESGEVAPIKWVVLYKDNHSLLLFALYAIDCGPYNEQDADTCWANCSLRQWLNNGFITSAFSQEEQMLLLTYKVKNHPNAVYGTLAGPDTEDRVFIPSVEDAEYYKYAPQDRMCQATPFCRNKGAFIDENGNCGWWLRSPGATLRTAVCIGGDGNIYKQGACVYRKEGCIRPAIRVMI